MTIYLKVVNASGAAQEMNMVLVGIGPYLCGRHRDCTHIRLLPGACEILGVPSALCIVGVFPITPSAT